MIHLTSTFVKPVFVWFILDKKLSIVKMASLKTSFKLQHQIKEILLMQCQ